MTFSVPINDRYFEDYVIGDVHDLGNVIVDYDEMLDFSRRYDMQVFHVDPEGAKKTPFGGIIASGWFTIALMMHIFIRDYMTHVAGLASPGVDEVRWFKPVRAGDRLSVRVTVVSAVGSKSKPDRGIVNSKIEVFNQATELVLSLICTNFIGRRSAG